MKKSEALKPIEREVLDLEQLDGSDEFGRASYGYGNGYGFEEPPKKFPVREYWDAVRKRLWLIASLCVVVTVVTMVYVAQKPDYYSATSRVQVNVEDNPMGKGSYVFSSGYDPTYFSSQLQIIEGSGLLRRVVNSLDLPNNQTFLNPRSNQNRSVWQNTLRMIGMLKPDKNSVQEPAANQLTPATNTLGDTTADILDEKSIEKLEPYVGRLKAGLTVMPVKEDRVSYKETRLIDINFTHADPEVASKMANAIADNYVALNLEKKVTVNATAGDFLQKRIAELQSQIRSNEERLMNYAKSNQIISLDAGQNTVVQRLADLNTRLSQAEGDRIMAEASYRASLVPGAANAQTETSDARSMALETRLSELRNSRARLLVEYTEEAPELVEIDRQIVLAQQEMAEMRSRATRTLTTNFETKYKEAQAREQDLRKVFNKQRGEVLAQNEAAINYRIIQQEIDTNKSLLAGLLQRSKENDVVLSGTPNNVLVVDRALTPRGPVGPQRARYIMLAFLVSFAFGLALALLLHYLDGALRSIDDIESKLMLPVLAAIPSVSGSSKGLIQLTSSLGRNRKAGFSKTALDLIDNPAMGEAYMHLRTSVLLATAGGPPETLLVTSGQPSEGKTTTAINLATVLSQTGAKVLLIDGDLRRPSLHTILGLKNSNGNGNGHTKGLSSILTDKELHEEAVFQSIEFHEERGFHVLQSGPLPPNPANLLCSPQMSALIVMLKARFTHIVIDSPPVTFFTDSVLLSRLVDGVLLVVRSGKSPEDVVQRARKVLGDAGANFFGVVLNDVPRARTEYYPYEYKRPSRLNPGDPSLLNLNSN
jgi:capsular exopolysaccharide synthesis family protein